MGVNVEILYIFAGAATLGLGLAQVIGIGVAVGLGGREHVDENVDRWMRSARDTAVEAERESPSGSPESPSGGPAGSPGGPGDEQPMSDRED